MSAPELQRLEGAEAFRQALISLIAEARQEICLASLCLAQRYYKDAQLVNTLKTHLLQNRRLQVRVLLEDAQQALRESEPLIELGRRLSSQFAFHTVTERQKLDQAELIIADERSYLIKQQAESLYADFAAEAPFDARQHQKAFKDSWNRSQPASALRVLRL